MPYRTILMHCNDARRIATLLAPAVRLAETFQAHLVGLSVVPPVAVISAGTPMGPPIIVDAHCELYRAENPAMKAAFEDAARERGFVAEWARMRLRPLAWRTLCLNMRAQPTW